MLLFLTIDYRIREVLTYRYYAINVNTSYLLQIHGFSVKVEVFNHNLNNLKGETHGHPNCNRFLSV